MQTTVAQCKEKLAAMQQQAAQLEVDITQMYATLVQLQLCTSGENALCMRAVHEELHYIALAVNT